MHASCFALAPALLFGCLQASALAQKMVEIEPFPEMRAGKDFERVAKERHFVWVEDASAKGGLKILGYRESQFIKGKLAGDAIYVHRCWTELLNHLTLSFDFEEELGLYDSKLRLIALHKRTTTLKKSVEEDYRWQDGALHYKEGRKKSKVLKGVVRTKSLACVLYVDPPTATQDRTFHVLEQGKSQEVRVSYKGVASVGDYKCVAYFSDAKGGSEYYMSKGKPVLYQARFKAAGSVWQNAEEPRSRCGIHLDPEKKCLDRVLRTSLESWTDRRNRYTNKYLGLSFRLPKKGWNRNGKCALNYIFNSRPPDGTAYFGICIHYPPRTTGFEGIVEQQLAERSKGSGKVVEQSTWKQGRIEGERIDILASGPIGKRQSTHILIPLEMCILEIHMHYWLGKGDEHKAKLASILKSLKIRH